MPINAPPPSQFFRFALPATAFSAGLLVASLGILLLPEVLGLARPAAPPPAGAPAARSLAWADLADGDTATFAENLRGIGCPEEMILRIVTTGHHVPELAAPDANAEANRESASPVVALPVVPARVSAPPSPSVPPPPELVIVAPAGRVPLPVAFHPLPRDAGMTPEQAAQLNAIQEEFIAGIGGPNQDPSSPEYRDRWRQAQRKSDAAFKAAFGQEAFLRRQMTMLREAAAPVPGS